MKVIQKTYEYNLDKYTFQNPDETITVIDEAISDIISDNNYLDIHSDNNYLEKVKTILSFLKIDDIFQEVSIQQNIGESTIAELRKKSGYAVFDSFLIIHLTSNNADKALIFEKYKKFKDYVSSFEENIKVKYETKNREVDREKTKKRVETEKKNLEVDRLIGFVVFLFIVLMIWLVYF